jgi:hypothetical protein
MVHNKVLTIILRDIMLFESQFDSLTRDFSKQYKNENLQPTMYTKLSKCAL